MAEDFSRHRQYQYQQTSNLVLEADRDRRRRTDKATGEVESLRGKLTGTRMGDRVHHSKPTEQLERMRKKRERDEVGGAGRKKRRNELLAGPSSVLAQAQQLDSVSAGGYRPKTRESREAYDRILSIVLDSIGSQPQDILRGAADEVLAILNDDSMREPDKQAETHKLLSKMTPARFSELTNLGKRCPDFTSADSLAVNSADGPGGSNTASAAMDEAMGVAVVFDEDDEEDAQSGVDEVRDKAYSDESDGDDASDEDEGARRALKGGENNDDDDADECDGDDVPIHSIDAYWLQRGLGEFFDDANESARMAEDVLAAMQNNDEREVENRLVMLLNFDKFDFIKKLLKNRAKIVFCTRHKQAQTDEARSAVEDEMRADPSGAGGAILQVLQQKGSAESWMQDRIGDFDSKARREARNLRRQGREQDDDVQVATTTSASSTTAPSASTAKSSAAASCVRPERTIDLESLTFHAGARTMSNKSCALPEESWRAQKKGYEEVHVPAVKAMVPEGEKLVDIAAMPDWTHAAFKGMKQLNRMQSRLHDAALNSAENLLLCAPTGAGKTNVAVLTMLQEIGRHRQDDGTINLNAFKMVYIAPMKALVQECVSNFSQRLKEPYGIVVRELSGDQNMTKKEIQETQLIVTTPEKWDIITRKSGDRAFTQLVRLIIIDEIHLLHDQRGPVLESIVSRTIRQMETTQELVRLVGLSATLPNFEDVATFMRVDPDKGLFFFDNTFRPVPLQQQYVGITEKKAIKRFALMNEICYQKVLEQAGKNQVLIFVHSRNETALTAAALRDMAMEEDTLGHFIAEASASQEILQDEVESVSNAQLKELLPYGFATHHAGMSRTDRNLVEDLFADGHVQVLVSTATLAWGVNLPAHTVIIKGTQIYNPDEGRWVELSPLDVMQMLGRAGRPQFDKSGEGIIITSHTELQYYLSLMNQQLPIESQQMSKLIDNLNAEIVLGSVHNVAEGANWLGYTYLYVRMLRNPSVYGISPGELESDPLLEQYRIDLIHSAASVLDRHNLIKYDRRSGQFQVTALGQVASHYYVTHHSIATFNDNLRPSLSEIELFRLFSLSYEFRNIVVREEEKLELAKLLGRVPIPVKEHMEEPSAKVNVLLQAYISRLKLNGFALVSDMVYIQQSASRILRALFEITLKRGWGALAEKMLNLCKIVGKRMWLSQTPLRQFRGIPEQLLRKIEQKDISWERYYDLKPHDIGELISAPKLGKTIHSLIHKFPRLDISAHVQPITRSTLRMELTITPDFEFDVEVHEFAQAFWVIVQDVDGENILHHEYFVLKQRNAEQEHQLNFSITLGDPLPPQYFLRVVSDRWLHSETILPISFRHLLLPDRYPPHTELLDLQPLPVKALSKQFAPLYNTFTHFNAVQTQTFKQLFETDDNVLVAAPVGSGKTVCAEFAILRFLRNRAEGTRCIYISPRPEILVHREQDWSQRFSQQFGLSVSSLTGDTPVDLKLMEGADIVLATAEQWDILSRRWKQRRVIQSVALCVVDELHLLGGTLGPMLEVTVSRMRYMAAQLQQPLRIVALGAAMANAPVLGDWIGARSQSLFNFHPTVRPCPLELHIRSFDINNFSARLLAMGKPCYAAICTHASDKSAIVFVPSRKQAQLTAIDMLTYAAADRDPQRFLSSESAVSQALPKVNTPALRHTLKFGVGYIDSGMRDDEREIVQRLFDDGVLRVLVVTHDLCWALRATARLVVVMDTQFYDGRDRRYVDYPIPDLLQMAGRANRPLLDKSSVCVVLCHVPKKDFLVKFLQDPLPVESHVNHFLHDHLNAEIVSKVIENKQEAVDWVTWTYLYRRLSQNPNYYNMQGTTHRHVSEFLSELVEDTISDLEGSRCVAVEEMSLSALNLGMIASYHCVKYTTIELFASSLTAKTKMKALLEIITSAAEFDDVPVRHREDRLLRKLAAHLPQKVESTTYDDSRVKVNVLLQAHFSRHRLPQELQSDQREILVKVPRLVQALVDVISSNGWLKPALAAMEFSQMITQALWDRDSSLLQIPHFTKDIVSRCDAADEEIDTAFDIMALEDEARDGLLRLPPAKMADVARFCNGFPNIDVEFELEDADDIETGDAVTMVVQLEREHDDEEPGAGNTHNAVYAPSFPRPKVEGWWLVMGDMATNTLVSIKRVNIRQKATVRLTFAAPDTAGDYNYSVFFMCDSYMGCDQELECAFSVKQGEEGDSDDDDEDDQ